MNIRATTTARTRKHFGGDKGKRVDHIALNKLPKNRPKMQCGCFENRMNHKGTGRTDTFDNISFIR